MPLLPWQRHPLRRLPLGRLPWQRETSAPDPQLAHSGLASPTAIHYARVPPKFSPETPLKAISGGIRRWLTGLCQPAPDHCPDNPLLSCFAAPLNVRDEGGCYGFEVELSGFDAKHLSTFARGQRLMVCGPRHQINDDRGQQRAQPQTHHGVPVSEAVQECEAGQEHEAGHVLADGSECPGCQAGKLVTSVTLPRDADLANLSAAIQRGTLTVRVPKQDLEDEAKGAPERNDTAPFPPRSSPAKA